MTNRVIAGDFENHIVTAYYNKVKITKGFGGRAVDSTTVANYEVVTEETQKSVASGVARGLAGGLLLGGVGLVAGAMSAKNKGIYQVAIEFVDGKKCLVEVDDKVYKAIVQNCFDTGKPKLTAEQLTEQDAGATKKEVGKLGKGLKWAAIVFIVVCMAAGIISKVSESKKKSMTATQPQKVESTAATK